MEKTNYHQKFLEELENIKDSKPSLLLHACCGPCSTNIIDTLKDHFNITIYFSNSNIYPSDEYYRRKDELFDFIGSYNHQNNTNIHVVSDGYEPEIFMCQLGVYGNVKEGGKRCYLCYQLRMEKAYKYANRNNFDYFTTTLSVSPHKNSQWINQIGEMVATKQTKWLYSDFKKDNGYQKSCAIASDYNLYRQNYCGCIYSYEQMLMYNEQKAGEE